MDDLSYFGIRHEGAAAIGKVAQWSETVLSSSRHAELLNLAVKSSIVNRGVSHLIFPDEVQNMHAPAGASAGGPQGRMTPTNIAPPQESLEQAAGLLGKAKRPVLIVGHGARFSMSEVMELAETLNCPCLQFLN